MEKTAIIMIIMMVMASMRVPSSAQQIAECLCAVGGGRCWRRIANCVADALDIDECCPDIRFELRNYRVCFCAVDLTLDRNSTLKRAVNTVLDFCDLYSFDILCPDSETPTSSPAYSYRRPSSSPTYSYRSPPTDAFAPSPRYNDDDSAHLKPYPSAPNPSNGKNLQVIVPAVVVPLVSVMAALFVVGFWFRKRKKTEKRPPPPPPPQPLQVTPPPPPPQPLHQVTDSSSGGGPGFHRDLYFANPESLQYEMASLQAATNNFSSINEIGRGGFGSVYKGILADGREIAVKRLSSISKQGDEEFKNEVLLLAKLQHKSLVSLIGFCLANTEKLLVYEFVANRSLDYFLFGDATIKRELDWPIRYNIIRGIAKALVYLHEDSPITIIHRDLKAANILLDRDMNPKVADFGLARVCSFEQTHVETSRVAGTIGYMAPEYMLHGRYSTKSDVYSFGVLILEIISGKRVGDFFRSPAGSLNLLNFAWTCWLDKKPLALVDPTLMRGSYSNDDIISCVHLGLLCVQEDISMRPGMAQIVQILKTNSIAAETLSMPQPPSFMYDSFTTQTTTTTNNTSSTFGSQNY